ncbi:hypothetical protein TWF696_005679 [Orbilia brochopaga]|uniref:Uncharacterized protein n=1 Tax=Orbilia brochopaga TaxID=3140254 RepID=A0AAV9UTY6_9PEZI
MHWSSIVTGAVTLAPLVSGHGLILSGRGCYNGNPFGPEGTAHGVVISTPRTEGGVTPFQQDVPVFRESDIHRWNKEGGRTLYGGVTDVKKCTQEQIDKGQLPTCVSGQFFNMTFHQVNGDGNGPFRCAIDESGTGKGDYREVFVVQNVPGQNPVLNSVVAQRFPLVVELPEDMECRGKYGKTRGVCVCRCQNRAQNGPFGGSISFVQIDEDEVPKSAKAKPVAPLPPNAVKPAARRRALTRRARLLERRSELSKRCLSLQQLKKVIEGEKVTTEELLLLMSEDPSPSLLKAEKHANQRQPTKSEKAIKANGKAVVKAEKQKQQEKEAAEQKKKWREWKDKKMAAQKNAAEKQKKKEAWRKWKYGGKAPPAANNSKPTTSQPPKPAQSQPPKSAPSKPAQSQPPKPAQSQPPKPAPKPVEKKPEPEPEEGPGGY